MPVDQMVTYMLHTGDAANLLPSLGKEIAIDTKGIDRTVSFPLFLTSVDNLRTARDPEWLDRAPTEDRSYHEGNYHDQIVENYQRRGYEVVSKLDYREWERKLEGIKGLEEFGKSDEQIETEFIIYLLEHGKL